jgi:two-component system, NtrC family, response regulator GlrR
LQDSEYRVVGSTRVLRANVRIIAAGNADFEHLIRDGRFREDLFYRLNVLRLALPALRERRADIALLARHFLEKHALLAREPTKALSPTALERLRAYAWPGNVRELENVLARAHFLSDRVVLQPEDLDLPLPLDAATGSFTAMKARVIWQFEREYLQTMVHSHHGNITQAARAAGKNRRAFYELLRKHGLPCSQT